MLVFFLFFGILSTPINVIHDDAIQRIAKEMKYKSAVKLIQKEMTVAEVEKALGHWSTNLGVGPFGAIIIYDNLGIEINCMYDRVTSISPRR
jgi:hypothetical protein